MLSTPIEHAARELTRVLALLELDDETLIAALGGGRRAELREWRRARLAPPRAASAGRWPSVCPHSPGSPPAPTVLHVAGDLARVRRAREEPLVAFVGARRASEHGRNLAFRLASELACAGVAVGGLFAEGIAAAALAGALGGGGAPLAVRASGLDCGETAHLSGLRRRLCRDGCLVSEMPEGARERRWSVLASGRILAALAQVVIVVEGRIDGPELELAALAGSHGTIVAAIPGRVDSANAQGPHALLRQGAPLVCNAQDALDLLYGASKVRLAAPTARLDARLAAVLERVASGQDTLERLLAEPDPAATLLAVGELEAAGLLRRGATGRYLPCIQVPR